MPRGHYPANMPLVPTSKMLLNWTLSYFVSSLASDFEKTDDIMKGYDILTR